MLLSDWDLKQLFYELAMADTETVRLPIRFVIAALVHPRAGLLLGMDEQRDQLAEAKAALDRYRYAKKRYRLDRTVPDTMQVPRALWHALVFMLCGDEGVKLDKRWPDNPYLGPAPLDMSPVSVEAIRRHLAEDPAPRWKVRDLFRAALRNVGLDGKPMVLKGAPSEELLRKDCATFDTLQEWSCIDEFAFLAEAKMKALGVPPSFIRARYDVDSKFWKELSPKKRNEAAGVLDCGSAKVRNNTDKPILFGNGGVVPAKQYDESLLPKGYDVVVRDDDHRVLLGMPPEDRRETDPWIPLNAEAVVDHRGKWVNEARDVMPRCFLGGYFMVARDATDDPKGTFSPHWMRGTIVQGAEWSHAGTAVLESVYGLAPNTGRRLVCRNNGMLTYLGNTWRDGWIAIADKLWSEDGEHKDRPRFRISDEIRNEHLRGNGGEATKTAAGKVREQWRGDNAERTPALPVAVEGAEGITQRRGEWLQDKFDPDVFFRGGYFMLLACEECEEDLTPWCNGTIIQGTYWLGQNGAGFDYAYGNEQAAQAKHGHVFPELLEHLAYLGPTWRPWWPTMAERINGGRDEMQQH